jgi:hypothetical protein
MHNIFLLPFMRFVLSYDVTVCLVLSYDITVCLVLSCLMMLLPHTLLYTQLLIMVNMFEIHSRSFYFLRHSFVSFSFLFVTYLSLWGIVQLQQEEKERHTGSGS